MGVCGGSAKAAQSPQAAPAAAPPRLDEGGENHGGRDGQAAPGNLGPTAVQAPPGEYDAVAAQADGFAEVVVKDQEGRQILAKVPNGDPLKVLQSDGTQAKVRWKNIEGWIKEVNMKRADTPATRAPLPEQPSTGVVGGGGPQVPYDAYVKQVDGHPDVALKDKDGRMVTKIPNGQAVKVVALEGEMAKLKWKEHEGFAKAVNVKPGEATGPTPAGQVQQKAIAKQSENFPEVVIKKDGGVVAKIPNDEEVTILRQEGDESLVRWGVYEGWAKTVNLQQMAGATPFSAADSSRLNRAGGSQMSLQGAGPTVTPKPTPHALPPGQSCGNLFVCGQITDEMRKLLVNLKPQSMKASMPKFNLPANGAALPDGLTPYDIPCFGPALTEVVTTMLTVDVVKQQANALRFMMPRCSINEVIQQKNKERGPQLVDAIKTAGGDLAAVKKLEDFLAKIAILKANDFLDANGQPRTDGKSWVDDFCPAGWKDKLHVDEVLTNFGFSQDFCNSFKPKVKAGSKDTWTDFAVRWLSKAFDIFSYQGSMSDVVNLIFAMLNKPEQKPDIATVVRTVKEFTEILKQKEWQKIVWKPTYIIHDSELDDMLAWLVCCTVGSQTGSNIYCSVQMPPSERELGQLDHLQAQYESRSDPKTGIVVFRDPSSRNREIVIYCACFVPPRFVYLVSETEMRSFVGKYAWDQDSNMYFGHSRRLYINPATGYWCISLDSKGMKKGYYQIRALKKGCIPHTNLGWRMLIQTENNPDNAKLADTAPQMWEEKNTNGRQAVWQDLNSEGEPILNGTVKQIPANVKPVFQFWISQDPREHPESPPLCLHGRGTPTQCRQEAKFDGWTRCAAHHRQSPKQKKDCPVYMEARKYLEELEVDDFIDHHWDHCWCSSCHPAHLDDVIQDPANKQQSCIVPRGWVAFGVVVSRHLREAGFENIFSWPNTFHGTRGDLALSILRHGHIGMPGDRKADGSTLKSVNCAGRQDVNQFYTSPTAAYAGLQLYARPRKSTTMPGTVGQVVLQCNQNREPGNILKEQCETMKFKAMGFPEYGVCKKTSLYSNGIEVISKRSDLCVIRRLLIRTFPENNPPSKSKPGEVKPIDGNYEQFRSPVDLKPSASSHGDGCLWL